MAHETQIIQSGFRNETARETWNAYAGSMTMESEIHPAARQMSFQVDDIVIENLSPILAPTLMIVGSEDKRAS